MTSLHWSLRLFLLVHTVSNIFQMLVIIAIHSGRTSAAGIRNLVLMNSRSAQSVRYYKTSCFVDIVIIISVVNSSEIHILQFRYIQLVLHLQTQYIRAMQDSSRESYQALWCN